MEQSNRELADRITGLKVYNVAGRKLGVVDEVAFDPATGEVDQVTVIDDGMFGFRRHRTKVAWNMVTYSETRHALVFAPGVHREHEDHIPPPREAGTQAQAAR